MSMCTPCSDQNEFPIGKCNPEDGKNASKKVPTTAKLSSPSARPPTRPAIEFNAMMVPNVTDGRRIITQQDMMVQSAMADAGNAFDVNAIDALSWTMGGVLRYGKNQKWVNIIKKGTLSFSAYQSISLRILLGVFHRCCVGSTLRRSSCQSVEHARQGIDPINGKSRFLFASLEHQV